MESRPSQAERGAAFAALHEGEPFVIPNPWDAGSARLLGSLGFQALATTSSGFAFSLGRRDGAVTLDEVCRHVRALSEATALPISVDLENGYGPEPEDAATAVTRAAESGAVGGSIEDYDGPAGEIYSLDHAAERVAAAREAVAGLGYDFTLTGRAENHFRGNPDLEDTVARLQAYERAGADVLFAPGLRSYEDMRTVVDSVSKPINVVARPGMTMAELVAAGVQRVSVGGALTFVAAAAAAAAAKEIRDGGDFSALAADVRLDEWLAG